jgi:hypothetical protein
MAQAHKDGQDSISADSVYDLVSTFLKAPAGDVAKVISDGSNGAAPDCKKDCKQKVRFNLRANTYHDVTPYSEVYGIHPRELYFHKYDKEPSWSFIADPDAEDVDENDLDLNTGERAMDEEEEDEGPQPFLARRGFCKPINPQTSFSLYDADDDGNDDDKDDDEVLTTAPSGMEGSDDSSSDSMLDEDGLPSPTDECEEVQTGCLSYSVDDVQATGSTKRCFSRCVRVEWCSVAAPSAVVKARDTPDTNGKTLPVQLWMQPMHNLAVLFCSLPKIMSQLVSSQCKQWWGNASTCSAPDSHLSSYSPHP